MKSERKSIDQLNWKSRHDDNQKHVLIWLIVVNILCLENFSIKSKH